VIHSGQILPDRPHLAAWLDIYLDSFATDQRATDIIRTYGPAKEKS
jgi:hypothetical protein